MEANNPDCTDPEWGAYPLHGELKVARGFAFEKRIPADAPIQLLRIYVALFMGRIFFETR